MIGDLHAHNIKNPLVYISVERNNQCCREQSTWKSTQAVPHEMETMKAAAIKQLWVRGNSVYPSWAKAGLGDPPSITDLRFRV